MGKPLLKQIFVMVVICIDKVQDGTAETHIVQIVVKIQAHSLFKDSGKILRREKMIPCDVIERERLPKILPDISLNGIQPVREHIFARLVFGRFFGGRTSARGNQIQHPVYQRIEPQLFVPFLAETMTGNFGEHFRS